MPEQPEVFTPRRRPRPLPRLLKKPCTCSAARSVRVMPIMLYTSEAGRWAPGQFAGSVAVFGLVVGHCRLDGVFGKDRTMDLDRRQGQLFGNLGVLDGQRFVQRL